MKVTKENLEGNKVKLNIVVEKEVVQSARNEALNRFAPHVKVKGFRPGKAPQNLVEKEIGQDRINAEILDIALQQSYYEAIIQEKIEVAGAPEVKVLKFVPTDELEYEAVIEVMPEVKVPDLTKIKVKREEVKVAEKEIEDTLNDLAKQLSKYSAVERPAKKTDRVEINFEGFLKGVPFEGGKSEHYPLVLGSGSFIPGFEEQLEGMKVNEEKEIKVTFPKDYHAENLKGQEVTFKVKVNQIEEVIMPELNDEFAKMVGPFADVKALKTDIEKELKSTKERQERKRVEDSILEEMVLKAKFDAPKSLVAQETQRLISEAEQNLAYSGMNLEKYFEMTKTTREQLEQELSVEGTKRVKVGLLLTEIAKEQKFTVDKKEIDELIEKRTAYLPEEEKKNSEEYFRSHEGTHQLENMIIGQKVIDYLYENCSK